MPINEILLVPHTHHDMGYTHVPETCMRMQERVIHDVLDLCERGNDSAPDAFRWTIEISRPLIAFLRHSTPADVERLRTLVSRRRLAVTGAYLHMTQLIGHEEYVRFFQPVREIRAHNLPVSIVQHGDINGLAWGSVPLMVDAGLDTLVLALNPDHGRPPFEQPSAFVWEGQDGSRILVWLSLHYSTANNPWELTAGRIDKAVAPLQTLINRLEARDDYPFDFVIIHSAEDNMLPNDHLCDAVRRWNDAGLQPPMRIVTLETAVERLRPFRDRLPVYRGEWADWWANGHGSSAYEVGVSRLARAELRAAELTRALAQIHGVESTRSLLHGDLPLTNWYRAGTVPPLREDWSQRVESTYDDLLLFEEHTWGSFESIDKPYSLFTQTHWNLKAGFAYRAAAEAHDLAREGLVKLALTLPQAPERSVIVVNPLSYARDELVEVRTPGVDHVMMIRDIPPLGARVVAWDAETVDRREVLDAPADGWFENVYYRLQVDPTSGSIVHLIDKATGREWVDSDALTGIGGVIYEQPDPDSDHPAVTQHRRYFHPDTPGPRFVHTPARGDQALTVRRAPYGVIITAETTAPFLPRIVTEITLFDDLKQIDISLQIDKLEN